jgi:hypothetical protein
MMIIISVIRKDAFKRLVISTSHENYLAILQIFESTDDVVNYHVAELDRNFQPKDKYIPNATGFNKWIEIGEING